MSGHLAILGGGQLGRMLAQAALRLGVSVRLLDPDPAAPAGQVAPCRTAGWDEAEALDWLLDGALALTWEREDIPITLLGELAQRVPVAPDPSVLKTVQDRRDQKQLFDRLGLPTAAWMTLEPGESPSAELLARPLPLMVKARRGGFDGRGQRLVRSETELIAACAAFAKTGCIVEDLVGFDDECAALCVRDAGGALRHWDPVLTCQADGQLERAEAPHPRVLRPSVVHAIAERVANALGHVGVLAVECFRVGQQLIVNEMAPRVHNSGHWTPEGSRCGQFENHVRAVLGWPLSDTTSHGHAGLRNCIGRLPQAAAVLAVPGATLTPYGKSGRPGRKVGHITVLARDRAQLLERCAQLDRALAPGQAVA